MSTKPKGGMGSADLQDEPGAGTALVDVLMWSSDAADLPTDEDALAAGVPEPMSAALLGLGGLALLRRRMA